MLQEMNTAYVLASASPRRKELLAYLQLKHVYQYAIDTDETIAKSWTSEETVLRLSVNKALAVFHSLHAMPEDFPIEMEKLAIIAADTIVVRDEQKLGKPKDEQDAYYMLKSLQGRSHEVFTGLTLLTSTHHDALAKGSLSLDAQALHMMSEIDVHVKRDNYEQFGRIGKYKELIFHEHLCKIQMGYTRNHVTFRPLSDEQIWSYIKTGDPLDKAGSYGIQGIGAVNIEAIDGDFYSVMGLPLGMLNTFINK